jgi:hypothetical protein
MRSGNIIGSKGLTVINIKTVVTDPFMDFRIFTFISKRRMDMFPASDARRAPYEADVKYGSHMIVLT